MQESSLRPGLKLNIKKGLKKRREKARLNLSSFEEVENLPLEKGAGRCC